MYVYLKYDGVLEEGMNVGVGKFECKMKLDMPREKFEEKLAKRKIYFHDTKIKINQLEKIEFIQEQQNGEELSEVYILPIGTRIKPKNLFQKIKTLYFG